ncbi:MAG: hypothetical protein C0518_03750 [Opitutus sp.]|nr:hypothetical protein [Opitutus sp.]
MKRLVLPVLLVLSAAGNLWLLRSSPELQSAPSLASTVPTTAAATGAPSTGAVANDPVSTAAGGTKKESASPKGVLWRPPQTDADFRTLALDLRAAGVPPRLIYAALRDLYRQQKLANSPLATAPYWKRRAVEALKEMREIYRQTERQVEELIGAVASPAERLGSVARARRYGDLPDAKIDQIARVERDYQEMQVDVFSAIAPGAYSSEEMTEHRKKTDLLKAEMRADLAKFLTPAELNSFELRNSDIARQLAATVREVPLSADAFSALYAARQAFETATASSPTNSLDQFAQRRAAQAAYIETARGILPDDSFYPFIAANESDYRTIAALGAQFAQVTPATAYQVWQLKNQFDQARSALLRSRPSAEAIQSAYADWNAQLENLIGKAASDAYRQTPVGRSFNAPPIRRAPPTSAPTPPRG